MKYYTFCGLWLALDRATKENDVDECNKLIGYIEEILPFESQEEHNKWLDVVETFKAWEDLQEVTWNIANRLKEER